MSDQIRLERTPIKAFYLGYFGADHLQLVYEKPTDLSQDTWNLIDGTREAGAPVARVGVDGTDGELTLADSNGGLGGSYLIDEIGTPVERGSRIIIFQQPASEVWTELAEWGAAIDDQFIPYIIARPRGTATPTINSTSVVTSLLYYVGIDINDVLPDRLRFTTGLHTLIGTNGDDELQIINAFDAIVGGEGDDVLEGAETGDGGSERLLGGRGNDVIKWSDGRNIISGSQPYLDYSEAGFDVVDYTGVGTVHFELSKYAVPNAKPDMIAIHPTGHDDLYAIDSVLFNKFSDVLTVGPGLGKLERAIKLILQQEDSGGLGDKVSFSDSDEALIINSAGGNNFFAQTLYNPSGSSAGMWLESAETLVGSKSNDKIYGSIDTRMIDGGAGNDLIDARETAVGTTNDTPIEIQGGDGDDTIISSLGVTMAAGGAGADKFVLSSLSFDATKVEFVITDADSSDRLFVPHNFFTTTGGDFEGSQLLGVLGGYMGWVGEDSFADLSERDDYSHAAFFAHLTQSQSWNTSDFTKGSFEFVGSILYTRDGGDLLIQLAPGEVLEDTTIGYLDQPWTYKYSRSFVNETAIVRVKDFTDGDLGIRFYDLGTPTEIELPAMGGRPRQSYDYPNADAAILAMTNGGSLFAPLESRPDAPVYDAGTTARVLPRQQITGSDGDDTIAVTTGAADVAAGGGNDDITTSSGEDTIDGGTGKDTMRGNAGNDLYKVDSANDLVIENAGEGLDRVISTVDYVLPSHVERLSLTGAATTGKGNDLDNGIYGNDENNTLSGLGGADVLYGGGGNDFLDGGNGSDAYVYNAGDGYDVIKDTGGAADKDVLVLGGGLTAADIKFHRDANSPNTVILTTADGGRIVLQGLLAASGGTIEQIEFEDGTIWTKSQLVQKSASSELRSNDAPVARDDKGFELRAGTVTIDSQAFLRNDSDFENDVLKITALSNVTKGISTSLDGKGNVVVTSAAGFTGDASFTYTVSDGKGSSTATVDLYVNANQAPIAHGSIPNQTATAGQAFQAQVPPNLFSDPDGDRLFISAKLANGAALPSWLHFNVTTGILSGTPPATASGSLALQLVATDGGFSASHAFTLTIENSGISSVLIGTNRADTLHGTDGNDQIEGRGANDMLFGNGGDDTFVSNGIANGFDRYSGGEGYDTILGSSGNDVIGIARASGSLSAIEAIDGGDGYDVLAIGSRPQRGAFTLDLSNVAMSGIELIKGSRGIDWIYGSKGSDTIRGGAGNDGLSGGGGDDVFLYEGRAGGFDAISGGDGFDRILGSSGNDVIGLRGLTSASSIEAIDGGGGRDVLMLTRGNDVLDLSHVAVSNIELIAGGKGNDLIHGSAGDDRISGGQGNDVFVFSGSFGHDRVTDFVPATARLEVAEFAPDLARLIDHDRIDVSAFNLLSFDEVLDLSSNTSQGVRIALDANNSILLEGLRVADLRAADFIL